MVLCLVHRKRRVKEKGSLEVCACCVPSGSTSLASRIGHHEKGRASLAGTVACYVTQATELLWLALPFYLALVPMLGCRQPQPSSQRTTSLDTAAQSMECRYSVQRQAVQMQWAVGCHCSRALEVNARPTRRGKYTILLRIMYPFETVTSGKAGEPAQQKGMVLSAV